MTFHRLSTALRDRYHIESELGQGGMAAVFQARDLKHDRDVAIKVLHADLGAALGPERFLSEIRTTARLQHPHILPLLDSGEADSLLYYVMPLVTGETLRARLERERQLPVDDAVRIAQEVADALHYAHGHGVIHRDIKPDNILLQDGHALVADFGIALAVQSAGGTRMTQTGLSLGTPQYMSPEQAMGERAIDARSDLYALAAVTYEMLVGEAPFTGPTVRAIVARVMTEEPRALTTQRKAIPLAVEDTVLRGLEKLPADRQATVAEFAQGLTNHSGRSTSERHLGGHAAWSPSRPRWRDPLVLGFGAITIGSLGWILLNGQHEALVEAPVVSFAEPISDAGSSVLGYSSLSISRDGTQLVYLSLGDSSRRQLVVRKLSGTDEQELPGTEDASHPVFSPDGRWVAFIRGNQLFKTRVEGGRPEPLGGAPGTFSGMSWARDGRIIVSGNTAIYSLPEAGGPPVSLVQPDTAAHEFNLATPVVLDEDGVVLYASYTGSSIDQAHIALAPLDGGPQTILGVEGTNPIGLIDGTLLYVTSSGALMGVEIDLRRRKLTGQPVQLLTGVRNNQTTGIARIALSRTGTLVYERGARLSHVVMAEGGKEVPLLTEPKDYAFPRLSPNGRTLAVTIGDGARRDVWLFDLTTGSPTRLTTDGSTNERPEWTPDGSHVVYRSNQGNRAAIWWRKADLSEEPRPLMSGPRLQLFEAVISPDGRRMAYQLDTLGADLWYRSLEGDTTAFPVSTNPNAIENMARISPDGKWIAFVTDESGVEAVVVQPFPGPGGRIQVSTEGGVQPVWARDGNSVIYRSGGWFLRARVQRTPTFAVTERDTLLRDDFINATNPHANFDVAPDGRLVALRSTSEGERVVVSNWRRTLRAAMAPPP